MKVAVIGGTGFVGSYIIDELLQQGHQPVLLARPGSESKVVQRERCMLVPGDVKDAQAVRNTVQGCDAVIYVIGIIREFREQGINFDELHYRAAARTADLAQEVGVKRFILMSANGVKAKGTPYQMTKYRAEEHLQSTSLDWTIFRPSVIYGDPRGKMEFCTQLRDQLINTPFPVPLFYEGLVPNAPGSFKLAPIHARDVATAFVKSLTLPESIHQTYGLCGPDALTWKAILELIAKVCGKSKLALPVPALGIQAMATLFDSFSFFPVTRGQITMLLEGNTCDSSEVFKRFGITPIRFNEASLAYLKQV
ncbi:MAG: complex I NDUFA9 subunit family protein [Candidatus Competibacteraceae bacterium]